MSRLGVQLGDAVDVLAADAGEVRHSDILLAVLIDDGHARYAGVVVGEAGAHEIEETRVDLVDDLDVAGSSEANMGRGQRSRASGRTV